MEVTIGEGKVMMCSVTNRVDGREGLLLRVTDEAHEIDSRDQDWNDGEPYTPTEADVVIWFNNLSGARVLQDRLNITCLHLNGHKVIDEM